MASATLRDELLCSICLSVFKDPVMLRCGHNFCRVCIGRVLDTHNKSRVYSCPECREQFKDRPALMRNIALRKIIENLLTPPIPTETGICCTYCVDSPVPAVKSCLHCEASLCDKHLRAHSKSPEHVLSEPSTSLEKRKCLHKKILEFYCNEDAACICVSCSLAGEYGRHDVQMIDEKKKLRNVLQKLTTKREKTEERVQSVEERRRKGQEKAAGEAERVTALFTDIRRRLDNLEKRVLSEISRQEKEESLSLSALIQKLEIKKDELSRKMRHIEELYIKSGIYAEGLIELLLDVNTASNNIHISDDLKTATWTEEEQNRPETAERFQDYNQVMSSRRFSSRRHCWDVESSTSGRWRVGMCYPSIGRRGGQSRIGYNNKSWGLERCKNQYLVIHDNKEILLPGNISSDRFRICLDYEAGQLSFYELCDPIRHLHTFTATFTEPLHAVLGVFWKKLDGALVDSWLKMRS
ncbi:E3 ubiquitin/ISG15 ligase TRIM25-like [Dendropsophus ebraccatus]|uniref:E3 ubiquitin/ISG15 ligase TRIM25-like n=1 Tax=Dendropsophus ebraccatus TaxID=150705 RepID=UPI003831F73C